MGVEGSDDISPREIRDGLKRVEDSVREARTEFQAAIAQHVTAAVFEARMETVMIRVLAADQRSLDNEIHIQRQEDERDRVRIAVFIAVFSSIVGPIILAVLVKGMG